MGIASTGTVKSLTLGIRGNKEDETPAVHHDNQVWYDGIIITDTEKNLPDIIDITRTPAKTKYSFTATFDSSDLGKIFSTNCHLYTSVATAKAAGTDPMCMVTCIRSMINQYDEGADPQMSKGLGMCLYPIEVDGQTRITWDVAGANISNAPQPYFSGHSVLRVGLPHIRTLERMAQCFGSSGGVIGTNYTNNDLGMLPSNSRINFDAKDLSKKLKAAVDAANGTSISFDSYGVWTSVYYEDPTNWTIPRPILWFNTQFEAALNTTKSYAFVYYQF